MWLHACGRRTNGLALVVAGALAWRLAILALLHNAVTAARRARRRWALLRGRTFGGGRGRGAVIWRRAVRGVWTFGRFRAGHKLATRVAAVRVWRLAVLAVIDDAVATVIRRRGHAATLALDALQIMLAVLAPATRAALVTTAITGKCAAGGQ